MKNSDTIQGSHQKKSAMREQPFKWPSTFVPSSYLSETKMEYRRRFVLSVGLSFFLNLFLLWVLLSSHGRTHPVVLKAKNERNESRLVLIERTPPAKPQTFLETDPNQAAKEKTENSNFYSEHNTVAAQTSHSEVKSNDIPKADGNNTKTMATETVRPSMTKPAPPPKEPVPNSPDKQLTHSGVKPVQKNPIELPKAGEFALLKPNSSEKPSPKEEPEDQSKANSQTSPRAPPVTPLSTREVPTSQSKLQGGVPRVGKAMQFNSSESPFAKYDKRVIAKISTYWQYQIVDRFSGEKVGQVEISFKLLEDGHVSEIQVIRNTANVILASWCMQAIEKSVPFDPFPESMRVLVGSYREATITFTY
jgi:outer membrane biosynthesis protein TonB